MEVQSTGVGDYPDPTGNVGGGLAVVIPCFRQGHFLASAIESVLEQSHPPDEIIVIDDGSPDDTGSVASRYPNVRCIRQDNAGLAGARNRGLRESSAEFVVFLDADDRLLPNAIATAVTVMLQREDLAFVWGFNCPIDAQGRLIGGISNPFDGDASYARLLERNIVGPPAGVTFRRRHLEELGGFSPALSCVEDYDIYLRLARRQPFRCHGQVVAEYRYHDAKMSSDRARMLASTLRILEQEAGWAGRDAVLQRAIAAGRRHARIAYAVAPAMDELVALVRQRRWASACRVASAMLSRFPLLSARECHRRLLAKARGSARPA